MDEMMTVDYRPNKTYFSMLDTFLTQKTKRNRLTFCNEGGSRSGKTYDTFNFLLDLIEVSNRPLEIHVYRETLVKCKSTTFKDFKEVLRLRGGRDGAEIYSEHQSPRVEIKVSTISFLGLDGTANSEGVKSDIVFINEALSGLTKDQYNNIIMRCEVMVIMDWNPRYSRHWVFDLEGQPNTFFTRTTFRDNQHISPAVRDSILAYEPTAVNIANGTADEYRWKVYGLGERAAQEGAIFTNIEWIDQFPSNIERIVYGLDFGYTNDPTALVKVGFETPNIVYLEELLYTPIADAGDMCDIICPLIGDSMCWADSADKYVKSGDSMIDALQTRGCSAVGVTKSKDSLVGGIELMKACDLRIVKSLNFEAEALNYTWDSVNGIAINRPVDKFNHLWDAARYVVLSELRYMIQI